MSQEVQEVFTLKGSMLTVPIIHLKQLNYEIFNQSLKTMAEKSPKLFASSPVIIDLKAMKDDAIDFKKLCRIIKRVGMVPVAFRNAMPDHREAAIKAGLGELHPSTEKKKRQNTAQPIKSNTSPKASAKPATKQAAPRPEVPEIKAPMIINKPVRSGQQIYAENSDLIVYGNVSSAAEVIADGNIMVHGVLGGKAIAGAKGRQSARILCQVLKADLIAIAGHYRLRDEMEDQTVPQSRFGTQIFLDQQHLCVEKI